MTINDTAQAITTDSIVATNGNSSGNGSVSSPINLSTLLSLYPTFWPGTTVKLRGGTYTGIFNVNLSGNPQGHITLQSYPNEIAKIDGSIYAKDDYLIFKDLEIYDSDFLDRTTDQAGSSPTDIPLYDGWRPEKPNAKLINCLIHDTRQGMLLDYKVVHTCEINGCVIFFNGWQGPDRGHGHGIYAANASDTPLVIKNSIIFGNFGYGLHCWAESVPGGYGEVLRNIQIENCVIFGNNLGGFNNNAIIGGSGQYTTVRNLILRNNIFYTTDDNLCLNLGSLSAGSTNATVENNLFVGGTMRFLDYGGAVVQNNKFYCSTQLFTSTDYPNNAYGSQPSTGNDIVVVEADYGKHVITIFNWELADTVVVDVSGIQELSANDNVNIWNVQAGIGTDIQSLQVAGDMTVTVDMQSANRVITAPNGWSAPATSFPKFGCFVLEKI